MSMSGGNNINYRPAGRFFLQRSRYTGFEYRRRNGLAISEEALLRSGFTQEELQKLKRYVDTQRSTLDILLPALSNRFKGIVILSVVLTVLFILAVCFASRENIISSGVAALFIFGIFCWMTPLKLTYKAWRFKKDYYQ